MLLQEICQALCLILLKSRAILEKKWRPNMALFEKKYNVDKKLREI